MDIQQLRCFCEAVESGSFSQAAKRLHVSQPTISAQIRRLEAELNVLALRRSGRRGTQLTAEGEVVYHFAREILRSAADMAGTLERMRSGTSGDVRAGASFSIHIYILPAVLARFSKQYPELQVHLESGLVSDILEMVVRGVVDLGIVWGPVDSTQFDVERLCIEEFVVAAPGKHPLARQPLVRAGTLAETPFIMNIEGSSTQRFVARALGALGVELKRPIHIGMPSAVKEGVLAGLGVGVVLRRAVEREIEEGRLVPLRVEGLELKRDLLLVRRKGQMPSAGQARWIDYLKAELSPRR